MTMLLPGATPGEWADAHLREYFHDYHEAEAEGLAQAAVTAADLLRDDGALLREAHATLLAQGSPAPAAARYVSAWFGGFAASVMGYVAVATGGALFVPDATTTWWVHPEGWTSRVDFGSSPLLVPEGHPWAGQPGIEVVADDGVRAARAVDALVALCTPLVTALNGLARGGLAGLWAEVGDGFGTAIMYQARFPIQEAGIRRLQSLANVPGTPWAKDAPEIWMVDARHAPVCVMRKGGCCLSFTDTHFAEDDEHENDEDHHLYRARFPAEAGHPDYCANCSFRPAADCQARQVWWREREYDNARAASA